MVASASSRSSRSGSGTHSSSSTNSARSDVRGDAGDAALARVPEQVVAELAGGVDARLIQRATHCPRVSRPPPASAAASDSRHGRRPLGQTQEAPPLRRAGERPRPISSSIQCASRDGTRWTVPRIGQVRRASRRSSAADVSWFASGSRGPATRARCQGPATAWRRTRSPRRRRRSDGRGAAGPSNSRLAIRRDRASVRVIRTGTSSSAAGYRWPTTRSGRADSP